MKSELRKLPKSQIQIDFELDEQEFSKYIDKALEHLKGHVKMDGFRPGQVPKEMVEKQIGNEGLLMEAGDLAVNESYNKFINEQRIEPIGKPEVLITKIAKGNPFLFKITVSVLPEIILPDYKEIVSTITSKEISVTEKEIEDAVHYLQKSRAKFTDKTTGVEKKDYVKIAYTNKDINGGKEIKDMFIVGDGGFLPDFEDNLLGMKVSDEKEFSAKFPENAPNGLGGKKGDFKVKMLAIQTMDLPEINDEFAKTLGQDAAGREGFLQSENPRPRADRGAGAPVLAFDSLVILKENIKEGVLVEKQEEEKQRKRGEVLSKISEKITFDLPEKMVKYEQERLFEDFKNQIVQNTGLTFEGYIASIKKTEEEIKKSFTIEAERRIKNFLVLQEIGKQEHIEVLPAELEEEMNKVVKNYTKESRLQGNRGSSMKSGQIEKIDINQLKEYTKGAIYNEKVFQVLETFFK